MQRLFINNKENVLDGSQLGIIVRTLYKLISWRQAPDALLKKEPTNSFGSFVTR